MSEPLLTPKEWADPPVVEGEYNDPLYSMVGNAPENPLRIGAYCLRGYFTWEHVDALREANVVTHVDDSGFDSDEAADARLRELADLIERLLPPREAP